MFEFFVVFSTEAQSYREHGDFVFVGFEVNLKSYNPPLASRQSGRIHSVE